MASMNLSEFFKDKSVYSWAKENKFPGPRIADAILYEKDPTIPRARPLGPSLAAKMADLTNGQVTFSELMPELAAKIKRALELEADASFSKETSS